MNIRLAILGCDGSRNKAGFSFRDKGVTFKADISGYVPVWLEARDQKLRDLAHLIGKAKLEIHEHVVWANCELLDDKLPENLLRQLWPHADGRITKCIGKHVMEMTVDSVVLSSDEPTDGRIGSLRDQGAKSARKGS